MLSRRLSALFLLACGALFPLGCSTKLGGSASNNTAAGRPCGHDSDCPQPENPCQVWTCWQEVCTPVAMAQNTLVPRGAQVPGDCKLLVCNGQGLTTQIPDEADAPAEDDNPCADEVCTDGEPAYPPLAVGTPCGRAGVCNGRGKCGSCLPEAKRCNGAAPELCTDEGAWESLGACPPRTPICSQEACIGILEVRAGVDFSCGRISNGKVRCFGDPDVGRLGQDGARRVAGLNRVVQVVAGAEHTCALHSDQTVSCFGSNQFGQLGDGTPDARGVPAQVPSLGKISQIAAGESFTCGASTTGSVFCWGSNEYGQLGVTPTPPRSKQGVIGTKATAGTNDHPVEVVGLSSAVELALGLDHACARLADGTVSCWGADNQGALGRGSPPLITDKKKLKPTKAIVAIRGLNGVREVAAGASHACARLEDDTVWCWGQNSHGQLGDGTTKARTSPVKVKGLTGVLQLSLGAAHSCALMEHGSVMCWGLGANNQLGDGTKTDHTEPTAVPGLAGVSAVSSGAWHVCAALSEGTFVCWGENQHGELGSGTSGEKPEPILW